MKNLEENIKANEYEQVNSNSISLVNYQESISVSNTNHNSNDLVSLLNTRINRQLELNVEARGESKEMSRKNIKDLSDYIQNGSDSYKRNAGQEMITFRHVTDFELGKIENQIKECDIVYDASAENKINKLNLPAIQTNSFIREGKTTPTMLYPHKKSLLDNNTDDQNKITQENERRKQRGLTRRQTMINRRQIITKDKSPKLTPATITSIMDKSEKSTNYGRSRRYLKYIDSTIALAVFINIILSIVDNDLYITYSETYLSNYTAHFNITNVNITVLETISNRTITYQENMLRYMNAGIILVILTLIYFHYLYKMKVYQAEDRLSKYDNIFTSGLYKYMLLEMIICGVFYPPYLNLVLTGSTAGVLYINNLNSIISFIVMFKCYIILRVYSYFSLWTSDLAKSICIKEKVKAGILFAIKAELKKRPYTVLILLLAASLGLSSFAMRTFEFGVISPAGITKGLKGNNELQILANCFWLIIITMTTVGYGDMFPRSNMGRLIGVFACIVGMVLLSMFIVSLAVVTQFTNEEEKAFMKMKKLKAEDNVEKKAANVIKVLILLRKINSARVNVLHESKKNKSSEKILPMYLVCITQLKMTISDFKNDFKIAFSHSVPVEEMLSRMELELEENIKKINENKFKLNTVESVLSKLTYIQDEIKRKSSMITCRQRNISNYLIKLNNSSHYKALPQA